LHAHQYDLRGIDRRATADRNHQIGFRVLGLPRNPDHRFAGGVLRDTVEGLDVTVTKRRADPLDLVSCGVERAARNNIDAFGSEALGLLAQRLRRRLAIDHRFHCRVLIASRLQHGPLRSYGTRVTWWPIRLTKSASGDCPCRPLDVDA